MARLSPLTFLILTVLSTSVLAGEGRRFRMGFTPFPWDISVEAVEDVKGFLSGHADLAAVHLEGVPWAEAYAGRRFSEHLREDWERHREAIPPGAKVYLAVTPIHLKRRGLASWHGEREDMPLPRAFAGKPFDAPIVRKAYLAYCRRAIAYFQPDWLCIGIEVNELHHHDKEQWAAWLRLHRFVYAELKKEHPDLPVFVSFTLHSMLNPEWSDRAEMLDGLRKVMPFSDLVGISFYPFLAKLSDRVDSSLSWVVREFRRYGKPFAVAECGEIAEPLHFEEAEVTIPGSQAGQRKVLDHFLRFCRRERTEFLVWFVSRDYDALWAKIRHGAVPEWIKAWRDCGLRDGEGAARRALELWDRELARALAVGR